MKKKGLVTLKDWEQRPFASPGGYICLLLFETEPYSEHQSRITICLEISLEGIIRWFVPILLINMPQVCLQFSKRLDPLDTE
ncbi:hypothetical protein AFLA_010693 [Aspergillus flavus NRRL3357]|nr:hypothetical protein AFLA_010693 [Aspergillus flavus NRRL3357]